MAVQTSYPGVYIEEFAPGAPIQGVSTSIPGFVGVAAAGEINLPYPVTSFDQFKQLYGQQPVSGYYLWHSVRGFFENGGQTCYIVRASNGEYAWADIANRAGNAMMRVRARNPGVAGNAIQVQVVRQNLIQGATLYQPQGQAVGINGRSLTMTDAAEAAQFRPTDIVDVNGTTAQIVRVSGDTITLANAIGVVQPAAVTLANLAAGATVIRVSPANFPGPLPANQLVPGSVLTISQNGIDDMQIVDSVSAEHLQTNPPSVTYRVGLRGGLVNGIDMAQAAQVQSEEVTITVSQGGGAGTPYPDLGLDPAHRRYFMDVINTESALVRMEPAIPPPVDQLPNSLPTAAAINLNNGIDEDLINLLDPVYFRAIEALRSVDRVSLVAVPGVTNAPVQQAVIDHCTLMADRFAVLDSRNGDVALGPNNSVEEQRPALDSARGYAALYFPWLRVISAATGKEIVVPPSGHICGIMARVDTTRGVHKAPANETVMGAHGVQTTMSNEEQGILNLAGINVIRVFQEGGRPMVWGARTTATDLNWMYINVRRLFLYVEESIQEGIQYAVFEPNNLGLWKRLNLSITDFLTGVWRDGALFGSEAKEAFYVRIDESLNPEAEKRQGRLHIEIGMRPTYPAEFIVVRIGIWLGGNAVSEG